MEKADKVWRGVLFGLQKSLVLIAQSMQFASLS
jgi:hypothetical protein